MTELFAAERMAMGDGPNPMRYGNSSLVSLRISGTGAAYRPAIREFVFREPAVWLSKAMQRRCIGLPIVIEHPEGGILDANTFHKTIVGIVVWPFVRDDELWGIGRFFDHVVAEQITAADGKFSFDTSPSVIFAPGDTSTLTLDDGETLLIEDVPSLIDHLALLVTDAGSAAGVWSKGVLNAGIDKTESKEMENA